MIINHTMLQNSRLAYETQRAAAYINNSASLFLMQRLSKEIDEHKRQLAKALDVNNLLVQEASTYYTLLPSASPLNQTWSNEQSHYQKIVKIEQSEESQSAIVEKKNRKQTKKHKNQIEGDEQSHDKNQTKNIPKNYGKAILSFIQKNIQKYLIILKPILQKERLSVGDLLAHIKKHKKEVNSINYLKEMWGYQDKANPILKCIRILSYVFMRKHCLAYIFNSRVKNYSTHIKYRMRVIEGIENPEEFTCIKQF